MFYSSGCVEARRKISLQIVYATTEFQVIKQLKHRNRWVLIYMKGNEISITERIFTASSLCLRYRTRPRIHSPKTPACSSKVWEAHTSINSNGEECGRLWLNDWRIATSCMERAFRIRRNITSGENR